MVALQHRYQAGLNARKQVAAESLKVPPPTPNLAPIVKSPVTNKAPISGKIVASRSSVPSVYQNPPVPRAAHGSVSCPISHPVSAY